jgi:hypothetical protein
MPSTNDTRTIHVRGMAIEAAHIEDRPGGGATLDIEHPDGRKWRVGVSGQGTVTEIVTAWEADGQVVPAEEPEWLDDALRQLAGAPA